VYTSTRNQNRAAATVSDARWAALSARSQKADGTFFYSVATTGVYCRPSCGARTPRPENVRFHATARDAERAGFRACKRCKPNEAPRAEQVPTLDELAVHAGLSRYHLHRIFKAVTGLTPRQYAAAHRARCLRGSLDRRATVTDAIFAAGYSSGGRFYENSNEMLGMTPTAYRAGGANTEIRFAVGECSLGSILVAATAVGVCAILMGDEPDRLTRDLQDRFPRATIVGGDAAFEQLVSKVVGFVEAPQHGLDLPLDVRGTAFQQRVWQALQEIPSGATVSYTELAQRIGRPQSVRAVAQACGANALAVAIPCHRVVRSDGELSGYRWGVERKRALLTRETKN